MNGLMSGRFRHPFIRAWRACRPRSSSKTCGGGSASTCRARHKATRTAVLSGSMRGRLWLMAGELLKAEFALTSADSECRPAPEFHPSVACSIVPTFGGFGIDSRSVRARARPPGRRQSAAVNGCKVLEAGQVSFRGGVDAVNLDACGGFRRFGKGRATIPFFVTRGVRL